MKNLSILLLLLSTILVSGQVTSKKDTLIRNSNLVIKPRVKKIPEPTYAPVDLKRDIRNDAVAMPEYEKNEDKIYSTAEIEVKPEFPGGDREFNLYINKNLNYPQKKRFNAKVICTFIVETNGSISSININNITNYDLNKEILKVLKSMPNWIPAMHNGKKVRCLISQPFMLDGKK